MILFHITLVSLSSNPRLKHTQTSETKQMKSETKKMKSEILQK